jgi:hypothetical protein
VPFKRGRQLPTRTVQRVQRDFWHRIWSKQQYVRQRNHNALWDLRRAEYPGRFTWVVSGSAYPTVSEAAGLSSRVIATCIGALFVFALPVVWLLSVAYLSARVESAEAAVIFVLDVLPAATAFIIAVGVAGAAAMRHTTGSMGLAFRRGLLIGVLGLGWLALLSEGIQSRSGSRLVVLSASIIAGALGGLAAGRYCVRFFVARETKPRKVPL